MGSRNSGRCRDDFCSLFVSAAAAVSVFAPAGRVIESAGFPTFAGFLGTSSLAFVNID